MSYVMQSAPRMTRRQEPLGDVAFLGGAAVIGAVIVGIVFLTSSEKRKARLGFADDPK